MRALCGARRAALLFQEYVVQAMEQFNTHFFSLKLGGGGSSAR